MESKYESLSRKISKNLTKLFLSNHPETRISTQLFRIHSPWPNWSCPSCSPPPIHPSRSFDLRCSPPPRWGSSKVPKESRGSALAAVGRDAEVPLAEVSCSGSLLGRSLSMRDWTSRKIKLYRWGGWQDGCAKPFYLCKYFFFDDLL